MMSPSDVGEQVVRLNHMVRTLNKLSASSFTESAELYKLFTDIMLEANKGREKTSERSGNVSNLHPVMADILRFFGDKK